MNEERPSAWADALLTLWAVVVGVVYFGGYFSPALGALTANASALYALMVFVSVLVMAFRYLRLGESAGNAGGARTKRRK